MNHLDRWGDGYMRYQTEQDRKRRNRRIGLKILAVLLFFIAATIGMLAKGAEPHRTPEEVVRDLERSFQFPPNGLASIWYAECSGQLVGQSSKCRNRRKERGAFQMTQRAAQMWYVNCDWKRLGTPGQFAYEATCAAAWLKHWEEVCDTFERAQGSYNRGKCADTTRYSKRVRAHAKRLAGG